MKKKKKIWISSKKLYIPFTFHYTYKAAFVLILTVNILMKKQAINPGNIKKSALKPLIQLSSTQ